MLSFYVIKGLLHKSAFFLCLHRVWPELHWLVHVQSLLPEKNFHIPLLSNEIQTQLSWIWIITHIRCKLANSQANLVSNQGVNIDMIVSFATPSAVSVTARYSLTLNAQTSASCWYWWPHLRPVLTEAQTCSVVAESLPCLSPTPYIFWGTFKIWFYKT